MSSTLRAVPFILAFILLLNATEMIWAVCMDSMRLTRTGFAESVRQCPLPNPQGLVSSGSMNLSSYLRQAAFSHLQLLYLQYQDDLLYRAMYVKDSECSEVPQKNE